MKHELLQDSWTLKEAERLQDKYYLISQKQQQKKVNFPTLKEIKSVVGVDISYFKKIDEEWGVSCAIFWDFEKNMMKEYSLAEDIIRFPYKPGYLGFRECNLLAQAINKLQNTPDVIMCDGHGIIHPKKFGEAVQLGVALDIPTIGIAKEPFVGHSNCKNLKRIKGERVPIWAEDPNNLLESDNEIIGQVLCLNDGIKPIFISEGYKMTIDLAINIALSTTQNHRQPEPLYLADSISRDYLKRK